LAIESDPGDLVRRDGSCSVVNDNEGLADNVGRTVENALSKREIKCATIYGN
jgi:hypothetical protein